MKKLPAKFLETETILAVFLLLQVYIIASQFYAPRPESTIPNYFEKLIALRFAALLIYALLAYLTLKNFKIAVWLMAAVLVIIGTGTSILGLFIVGFQQYIFKLFSVIIGVYFVSGGIMLPKNRLKMVNQL